MEVAASVIGTAVFLLSKRRMLKHLGHTWVFTECFPTMHFIDSINQKYFKELSRCVKKLLEAEL